MRTWLLGFCWLFGFFVFVLADPAAAGGMSHGWVDGDNINAGVGTENTSGGSPGGSGGGTSAAPVCTYAILIGEDAESAERFSQSSMGPEKGPEPGAWFREICTDARGYTTGLIVWRQITIDPRDVARRALSSAPLNSPSLHMNPSSDHVQIVGLPIWLSIGANNWTPVSTSASEGGITATTTARPVRVIWETGDGNTTNCNGPGATYDPNLPENVQHSDCTYAYRMSSAGMPNGHYRLSATEEWHVTWVATGVPAGMSASGDLGVVRRTTNTSIRVGEIQTLNGKG